LGKEELEVLKELEIGKSASKQKSSLFSRGSKSK